MNNQEKYKFVLETLKNFQNYIEVEDFRRFLLLVMNLSSGGPEAMLQQLGMAPKEKSILPYDPESKLFYTKIMAGLSFKNALTVFHRTEKKPASFINKADSEIFTKNLNDFEQKNLLPKKYTLLTPEIVDFTHITLKKQDLINKRQIAIESLYSNLGEMIATQELKFLFLLKEEKADLAFIVNLSIDSGKDSEEDIQFFDIYVDTEHILRNHSFIRMKSSDLKAGNLNIEYLDEIKDLNHSELFESIFTIIIPVKFTACPFK